MEFNLLIMDELLLRLIKNEDLKCVLLIFDETQKFKYKYILPEKLIASIYEELYLKRKNDQCKELSLWLDKQGGKNILINSELYTTLSNEINAISENETNDIKDILYRCEGAFFDKGNLNLRVESNESLRFIDSVDDLQKVMSIFGENIDSLLDFKNYIMDLYSNIIFDEELDSSLNKLSEEFITRRNEILYHLYCINKEIPEIIKGGTVGYSLIGDKMSIECSPEKKREIVRSRLTKIVSA